MDSRYESGAASKSEKVRFRCDQTRQFRAVAGRGVGSPEEPELVDSAGRWSRVDGHRHYIYRSPGRQLTARGGEKPSPGLGSNPRSRPTRRASSRSLVLIAPDQPSYRVNQLGNREGFLKEHVARFKLIGGCSEAEVSHRHGGGDWVGAHSLCSTPWPTYPGG